jgi:excisionase family DNA binding protein
MPTTMEPERRHLTRDDVLDGREVAELLHLPASTVREYARRGVLPAHRLGRRWVFIHDEVAAALRAAPQAAPARQPPAVTARPSREDGAVIQLVLPIDGA